jgi:hypothetical protein
LSPSVSLAFSLPSHRSSSHSPPYAFMSHHHHHFRARCHKWGRTHDIWHFELGLSLSVWWSPVLSTLLPISLFFIISHELYTNKVFSSVIHLLRILTDSTVWLLWKTMQKTWVWRYFSHISTYMSLDIYPRVV